SMPASTRSARRYGRSWRAPASTTDTSSTCAGSRSACTASTDGWEGAMAEPSVSVCVPSYNGVRHIEECLDSVVAQTYDDLEVLVVDEACTARTAGGAAAV